MARTVTPLAGGRLAPEVKRLLVEGIPADRMLEHDSVPDLLYEVSEWGRDYARWHEECGIALTLGYTVETWDGQIPVERRAAVLLRISNQNQGQAEVKLAWRLCRWAIQSLMDEYTRKQLPSVSSYTPQ